MVSVMIRPWCAVTIWATNDKPSPEPLFFCCKRTKGLKTSSRLFSGIPSPSSITASTANFGSGRVGSAFGFLRCLLNMPSLRVAFAVSPFSLLPFSLLGSLVALLASSFSVLTFLSASSICLLIVLSSMSLMEVSCCSGTARQITFLIFSVRSVVKR